MGGQKNGDLWIHVVAPHLFVKCLQVFNTFITSSPRWLMTLAAIRPEAGLPQRPFTDRACGFFSALASPAPGNGFLRDLL